MVFLQKYCDQHIFLFQMTQLRQEYKQRREDYYDELDEVQEEMNQKRFSQIFNTIIPNWLTPCRLIFVWFDKVKISHPL